MLNLPLSGIKRIEAIAQSSSEYISLSQGALRIGGIPKQIKEYIKTVLDTDKTDYYKSAWGIMPLREKIAALSSEKYNTKFSANNVIVTHGCIGALATLFFTLLEPGDEIILPEPTYPAYQNLATLARCNSVYISCLNDNVNLNENDYWTLDLEKIKEATTSKTKLIVFSNPCNPLGITIAENTILELIDWCEKNKIYLIIDEVYEDYNFNNNFKSVASFVNQSEWVIKVASFSKNFALSGWRVGYMLTPEKINIAAGNVQDALINCPNVPSQYAAIYALDHPELTQNFYNITKNNLDLSKRLLKPLVDKKIFSHSKSIDGFYLFLKTELLDSTELCMNILNKAKVGLVPGKFFGPSGAPFLRLCYARDPEILQLGIKRILKYFS